jgi:streptogramin lyase
MRIAIALLMAGFAAYRGARPIAVNQIASHTLESPPASAALAGAGIPGRSIFPLAVFGFVGLGLHDGKRRGRNKSTRRVRAGDRFGRALLVIILASATVDTSTAQTPSVGITTYPVGPGFFISGLAAGPDGAVWFGGAGPNAPPMVGRITAAGAITKYVVSAAPAGIAAGADGAFWFTEPSAHKIGRITTGGGITEYAIPCCGEPRAITAGPDGALWFSEGNKIGRITTGGQVSEYPLPNNNAPASGITSGPDGALWFTESAYGGCDSGPGVDGKIGRITTSGLVMEYSVGACRVGLSITAGSDGALWFTESNYHYSIGRITTSGSISEYALPDWEYTSSITTGPDGALWFLAFNLSSGDSTLGRITTAGAITHYNAPVLTVNSRITTAPDGALWFNDTVDNQGNGGNVVRAAVGATGAPQPVSVVPAALNTPDQEFTFSFTDPAGYQDLGVVNILINNFLDGRQACYLAYSQPSNTLFLVDDAGEAGGPFAGSGRLDAAGTMHNSQCLVSWTSAAVNHSGSNLSLALTIQFTASFAGNKVIYMAARNGTGTGAGWMPLGVAQAAGGAAMVTTDALSVRPSCCSGPSATFTFTFSDTKGWQDLGIVNILINGSLDARGACYLAYSAPLKLLYLVDDSGTGVSMGLPLGGPIGSASNGQCTVTAAGSSAAVSGNTLSLTLNLAFSTSFAGNKVMYLAARDQSELNNSGWQALGTWRVQD